LFVQRLPVPHTPSDELRPFRYDWQWILLLGKEAPQRGVMPAELVSRAVSMGANATAELPDFAEELLP
jgi:hypothetical protein